MWLAGGLRCVPLVRGAGSGWVVASLAAGDMVLCGPLLLGVPYGGLLLAILVLMPLYLWGGDGIMWGWRWRHVRAGSR